MSQARAHLDDFADLPVRDGYPHAGEVGVEPPLQGGHELDVSQLAGVNGLDRLRHVRRDGLLAKHVLTLGRTGFDLFWASSYINETMGWVDTRGERREGE